MALEGDLKDFGLADILQLIFFQRKTGVLTLEGRVDTVRISFVEGNVVMVTSKRRPEGARLGRVLIQKGLLKEEDLRKAQEQSKGSSDKLGKVLHKQGKVALEDLVEVLSAQMTQTITHLFNWKTGHYEFVGQDVAVDPDVAVSLDTEHLLMDGLRVTDEWSTLSDKIELDTVYEKIGVYSDKLDKNEEIVFFLVNGRDDVSSIMDTSGLGQMETARAIVALSEKALIIATTAPEVSHDEAVKQRKRFAFVREYTVQIILTLFIVFAGLFMIFQLKDLYPELNHYQIGVGIEELRVRIQIYKAVNGSYPDRLEDLGILSANARNIPFVYRLENDGRDYSILNVGPDGRAFTEDDIR